MKYKYPFGYHSQDTKMSDPNYPDDIRQYDHDHRSPFYSDPTESPEYEAMFNRLLDDQASVPDICIEAVGELSALTAKRISDAFLEHRKDPEKLSHLLEIGRIVYVAIERYCTPDQEDVLAAIEGDGDGF